MRRLIFRLFISLIVFTIVLIVLISAYNQQVLMRDIKSEQKQAWNLVESHIITDMQTVDKAHLYFDTTYSAEMERELYTLRDYYDTNPDIYTWDLEEIKTHTGMEIFIINNQNKIVVATHTLSIDFDFNECCEKFAKLLNERRMTDEFFSDGLENSVITKKLAKYGYLSTSDHQYILGIGGEVSELPLFQEFNFYNSIEQLTKKYEDLMNICVIDYEGEFLEWHGSYTSIDDFPDDLREAYEAALTTNVPTEVVHALENNRKLTNRFVPYKAEFTSGPATNHIIYFQFSNDLELALLKRNTQRMFVALALGILIACFMLAIIIKILLTTLRRATYDTLTGIYNRASYLDYMEKMLQSKSSHPVGLLLIDIDNFKYVNDHFGHIEGDAVLKELGQILKPIAKMHFPVRFGGDEFAIVISRASEEKLERYATNLLDAVRKQQQHSEIWQHISISIGGAFQQQNQETEVSLFMRADQALYTSKHQGKDCYTFKEIEN
jgi:diguanylate cyclase